MRKESLAHDAAVNCGLRRPSEGNNSLKHSGLFLLTGIGPLGVLRKPSEGLAIRKPSAVSGERRSSGILSNHPAHQEVQESSAKCKIFL